MPLTNKYLKFSKDINSEIFHLIWKKLLSLGIKGKIYDFAEDNSLWSFERYGYIWIGPYNEYSFGIDNNKGHIQFTETTVQEILGYDPFVKEFVLPEKWYIKCTNESKQSLDKWTGFTWTYNYIYSNKTHSKEFSGEGYTEITFDQFKKYVLKETIETPKEVIPEYVECIKGNGDYDYNVVGKIYLVNLYNSDKGIISINGAYIHDIFFGDKSLSNQNSTDFKPSTKEAFDAQNKPKSIEKWSVGSYFVIEKNGLYNISSSKRGDICLIKEKGNFNFINKKDTTNWSFDFREGSKWFATKPEAEEFAKTLVQPVKEEIKTPQLDLNEWLDKYKKLNLAVNDLANAIELANFDKVFLKLEGTNSKEKSNILYDLWNPKQPLKQAVHCTTQEEWDFVSNKIGYKFLTNFKLGRNDTINTTQQTCECKAFYERRGEYQLLSFQEWCDLNGYKMENEVKFEVGKWYYCEGMYKWYFKYVEGDADKLYSYDWIDVLSNRFEKESTLKSVSKPRIIKLASIEEIQQYLPDNHPDKIKSNQEFKVGNWVYFLGINKNLVTSYWNIGRVYKIYSISNNSLTFEYENGPSNAIDQFRHATLEEINNHLISIEQVQDLGKLEPDKYPFKPLQPGDLEWEIQVPNPYYGVIFQSEPVPMTKDNWKHKMILSIDDEELPMVSIIKTNSIKQLLNND